MIENAEAIVEAMIREARQIVLGAIAEHHPIAMVAAFSGGNDSVVSTHFAATEFQAGVLHCNTGIGLKATNEHVHRTCERFGWKLCEEVARPEGRPDLLSDESLPEGRWESGETAYEEFVLNFGFAGPGQHPRMYQRLKERSIDRHVRDLKVGTKRGSRVLIISGIRGDESSIRAGYRRAVQQSPRNQAQVWVNPFYWRSAGDFELYRQEFGLPRNPVKDRIGISGECMCGAFRESESERLAIRAVDPEFSAYLDDLEARVHARGFLWNWGERRPKWFKDEIDGQQFMFDVKPEFTPMCVGCIRRRR